MAEATPAPAAQTNEPPKRIIQDDILSALAEDLNIIVEQEKKKDEPPAAPEIKAVKEETPPKEGEKKEEEQKEAEKVKAGIKPPAPTAAAIADEVVVRLEKKQPTPLPPKDEKKDPPIYDESLLSPEQKEELEDARFAEGKMGKKGRSDELLRYYKSVDEYVEAHKGEEDRSFDQSDEEFVKFINGKRPQWADKERDQVRRARLKEEVKEEAKKELRAESEPKIEKAVAEAREARVAPVIEKKIAEFRTELEKETKTEDPLEQEIYNSFKKASEELATDYLRLINGVDTFGEHNPPEKQQRQQWLVSFLHQQSELFERKGGDNRVRDGKTFVTAEKYFQMTQSKDTKIDQVWTFGPDDYLKMLRTQAVGMAKLEIKREEETAEKRGFVRAKPKNSTKTQENVEPVSGVKVTSTPAPGAVQDSGDQNLDHPGKELIQVLGLKG